jgi:hypothetical protein
MSDWVITGPNETEFCFMAETKLGAEFATAPLVTMSDNGKPRQMKIFKYMVMKITTRFIQIAQCAKPEKNTSSAIERNTTKLTSVILERSDLAD